MMPAWEAAVMEPEAMGLDMDTVMGTDMATETEENQGLTATVTIQMKRKSNRCGSAY